MIRRYRNLLLSLLLISFFILTGCTKTPAPYSTQIFALDTVIDITAYGEEAKAATSAAVSEIYRLEKLFSVTDENSDIYKLNNSEDKNLIVNPDTYKLLGFSKNASIKTQGNFDPTIYPVLKLWGFTQKEYRVPSDTEIAAALNKVDFENIVLEKDNAVSLKNRAEIDLGGIAKGFIADKAAEAMKEAGCNSGLISLGGNIRTIGQKPNGDNWSIGIKNPEGNDYFATLSVEDCSLITSGAYQRNFTENGITYHHILDPDTGKPSDSDILSVTIIGKDGALCDALSTAIFVGGTDFAETLHSNEFGFEYVILTNNKTIFASHGIKNSFSLTDNFSSFEIIYK